MTAVPAEHRTGSARRWWSMVGVEVRLTGTGTGYGRHRRLPPTGLLSLAGGERPPW